MKHHDVVKAFARLSFIEVLLTIMMAVAMGAIGLKLFRLEQRVETLSAPAGQLIYDIDKRAWVCNGCDPEVFRQALGFPPKETQHGGQPEDTGPERARADRPATGAARP